MTCRSPASAVSRVLAGAGGLVAVAGVVGGVRRRRSLLALVAPELRSPLLYAPTDVTNPVVLRLGRALIVQPTPIVRGVEVGHRSVATGPDGAATDVITYARPDRADPSGAVLWIHGGGLIMGHPKQNHAVCSQIADELGVLVVGLDYRLAPEHPFPAGLDDCLAVLDWLHDHAGELGVDPTRVAVAGDSAGGGLAAAVAQAARDRGGPSLCFQALVYPMLDDRTGAGGTERGGHFIWTAASNRFAWRSYLGDASDRATRPYASPGRAEDLHGLPPAWIGVGDLDLFLAEDLDYARRLDDAGVPCDLHVEPGMYHGADAVVPKAPSMRAFHAHLIAALRPALEPPPAA